MRKALAAVLVLSLTMTPWGTSSAIASPSCTANPDKGIICQGSVAWRDGFLVSREFVSQCKADYEVAAKVPVLQGQRDEAMTQRDDALSRAAALTALVGVRDVRVAQLVDENGQLNVKVDALYGMGDMALAGLVGAGVGVVVLGLVVILK